MKRRFFLLSAMAVLIPTLLQAKDDPKYLAGAAPLTNGKLVFTKTFDTPDADAAFDKVTLWLENRTKTIGGNSAVVLADKEKEQIVAMCTEYLVFTDKILMLDRSLITYNIYAIVSGGKTEIRVERIRFDYKDEKFLAEEYVADESTLNRKKTAIIAGYRKFRVHTIDLIDTIMKEAEEALTNK
ncbi:MAG: DUF4468 domain-containing protein [Dysgonamonadaceae bacterium]|jgi:hypothetical protein|nr:DUF4468 domain-containing protein [Dysgonamonadaceae bacterium]